jgi:predicted AAA+ superfamily ATPase
MIVQFGVINSKKEAIMEYIIPRKIPLFAQSTLLLGPRGTGKSTWLKKIFPDAFYIDLLDAENYRKYNARPERITEVLEAINQEVIIIDEIQKIPELLDSVHIAIEKNHNKQFVLTGSSARKLRRSGVNLLGGRLINKTMHPFIFSETEKKLSLTDALKNGLLPLVFNSKNPNETLQAYIDLYIREEVYAEGLTRNIGNFSRFLEAVSFSHGSILNISSVARDCEVGRKTVEGYIDILCDILLASKVPMFTKKAKRHLVNHPKFYFFDTGVYTALRPKGPLDNPETISGVALEGLVFQHLKAWIEYSKNKWNLYYWRTKSGTEVDFIIYGENGLIAIEVKLTRTVKKEYLKALSAFREDYDVAKCFLLYMGKEKLVINNISCLPVEYFLKESIL